MAASSTAAGTTTICGPSGLSISPATVLDSNHSDQVTDQIKYASLFCRFIFCGLTFETVDAGLIPALRRAPDGKVHVACLRSGAGRHAVRNGGT